MALFLTSARICGRQYVACGGNHSAEAWNDAEVTQQVNIIGEGRSSAPAICVSNDIGYTLSPLRLGATGALIDQVYLQFINMPGAPNH
jgi:hypothetical protein